MEIIIVSMELIFVGTGGDGNEICEVDGDGCNFRPEAGVHIECISSRSEVCMSVLVSCWADTQAESE